MFQILRISEKIYTMEADFDQHACHLNLRMSLLHELRLLRLSHHAANLLEGSAEI
jgi:hypothetical protein